MMPAEAASPLTRKQIMAEARRLRAKAIAQDRERKQEAADEAIAPAVLRNAVLAADGTVIRGPMVERDGISFVQARSVRKLYIAQKRMGPITQAHVESAERLAATYRAVGAGCGVSSSDYASKTSGGGFTGGLSQAKHVAMLAQIRQRVELEGAFTWLGGGVAIVRAVVFDGIVITAWAKSQGIDREIALGMLVATLSRLVEFYEPESGRERPVRIRAAQFESSREKNA